MQHVYAKGIRMNPECPKCDSTSTRRRARAKSLSHRLMFLMGFFPWECLTCQRIFFSRKRYARTKRHPLGEIYTGPESRPSVKPGSEEGHSH